MTLQSLTGLARSLSMSECTMTQKRARTRTLAQVCSRSSTHTHTRPCITCARREDMKSTLSPALRDAHALDLARLRSTNLNSAPSVALFNGSTDKCTALVHSAVGTRMHASFTRRSAPSGPMYASCAPAARGGRACGAEIFIIFHQHG